MISDTFSCLKLKDEPFEVYTPSAHEEINDLFATAEFNKNLKANDTKADLPQRLKLAQYLSHCAKERTYFVSLKKCGSRECNICKPPRLNDHAFQRLDHLPDPTPDDATHYKRFSEVFGTQTTEAAMPSLKTSKDHGSKVPFNVVKQHATNTGITIECGECSKPRLVVSAKKLTAHEKKAFHRLMSDMLYTCGATLSEFKNSTDPNNCRYSILDNCFVRANHNCSKPVEPLYCPCNYTECCCHCGSKRRLTTTTNEYPICTTCKVVKKLPAILKRKRKAITL